MTRSNKYPDGYLPKITYWANTFNEALRMGDYIRMEYASDKLAYFTKMENSRREKEKV